MKNMTSTKTSKTVYAEITNTFTFGLGGAFDIGLRWKLLRREITSNGVSFTDADGINTIIPWSHCKLVEVTKTTTETFSEQTITL